LTVAAPSKFTPETRAKIILCIENGMSRQSACAHANITRKTLNDWEKRAVEEAEYDAFVDEMQLAQDRAQGKLEAIVNAKSTGGTIEDVDVGKADLRALMFQLQCGGTRPWAEKTTVAVTGPDGGPLEIAEKATNRIGTALAKMAERFRQGSKPEPAPQTPPTP
jgi:hypothetical protein